MNKAAKARTPAPRRRRPVADGFALGAIGAVALAIGVGAHSQFGLTPWLAATGALSLFVAFACGHVLMRRSERLIALQREVARLDGEFARLRREPAARRAETGPAPDPRSGARGAALIEERPKPAPEAGGAPPLEASAPVAPELRATEPPADGIMTGGEDVGRYWAFRPAAPQLDLPGPNVMGRMTADHPPTVAAAAVGPSTSTAALMALPDPSSRGPFGAPAPEPPRMPATARSEQTNADDVAAMHGLIKKLAEDINANSVTADASAGRGAEEALPLQQATAMQATAIDASVEALRIASQSMRATLIQDAAQGGDANSMSQPPPVGPAQERLAAIADALAGESIDVFLEPILGLADQRPQHYEVTVRLRAGPFGALSAADVAPAVRGTGLLPLLDALRVERTARVARHMDERGKTGALFSQVSGEAIASARFMSEFADAYRERETVAGRLVLSFAQSDVRAFSAPQWATLKDMAASGFRFALEAVADLDMDFEALSRAGFAFVKLDARVFADGLPGAGGMLPAHELCRHLAGAGLALIVGRIDDERQLARLLGFGVLLGQGALFGGPRPVKAEVLRGARIAA